MYERHRIQHIESVHQPRASRAVHQSECRNPCIRIHKWAYKLPVSSLKILPLEEHGVNITRSRTSLTQ